MESPLPPIVTELKKLLGIKGTIKSFPQSGEEAICVKEQQIGENYSVVVAVGRVSAISSRYFDVQGQLFSDTFQSFMENSLRIEPKLISMGRGQKYSCAVFVPGLIRKIDEAIWADKFHDLKDLIRILQI